MKWKCNPGKVFLVVSCCFICSFFTTGCWFTDIAADMTRVPNISGDWYNGEINTYLSFKNDGTFTMGYGKGTVNTGGTYDIDTKNITLHLAYTVNSDGEKVDWDQNSTTGSKGKILLPYEFKSSEEMLMKSGGGNYSYEKIGGLDIELSTSKLIGQWTYEKGGLIIEFKENGLFVMTDGETLTESKGTFTLEGDQLILIGENLNQTFSLTLTTENRLSMSNSKGEFFYDRTEERAQ